MKLTYPTFIAWRVDLSNIQDPLQIFSQSNQQKIKKAFALLKNSPYHFIIQEVNPLYIEKFLPIYKTGIQAMKHGEIYNVAGLSKKIPKHHYEAVSLYEGEKYCGGQIFRHINHTLSVNYRMFPHSLKTKLPTNIGILADHCFYQHALKIGKTAITHGRDRNVFGLHSNIGLARYKLEVGARPFVSRNSRSEIVHEYEPPRDEDTLVFLGDQPGSMIEKAILFAITPKDEIQKKYGFIIKHFPVEIHQLL